MNAKKLLLLVLAILLPFANTIIASNDFSLMQEYGDTNETAGDQTSSLLTETSKELMQAYDLLEMLKKRSDEIAQSDLLIRKDMNTQLPRNIDQIRNRLVKKQLLDVLSATSFSNPEKHLNDCKAAILALESYMAELKQQPATAAISTGSATLFTAKTPIEKEISHTYDISNEASTAEKASAVVPASLPTPVITPPLPLTPATPTPSILSSVAPLLPAPPPIATTPAPLPTPELVPAPPAIATDTMPKPVSHDLPHPTLPTASTMPSKPVIPTSAPTAPIPTTPILPTPNPVTTPTAPALPLTPPAPAPMATPKPLLPTSQPAPTSMPPALPVPPVKTAA